MPLSYLIIIKLEFTFREMISLAVYTAVIYYGIIRLKPDVALCWFSEHVYGVTLIFLAWWYLKSGKWRGKKV